MKSLKLPLPTEHIFVTNVMVMYPDELHGPGGAKVPHPFHITDSIPSRFQKVPFIILLFHKGTDWKKSSRDKWTSQEELKEAPPTEYLRNLKAIRTTYTIMKDDKNSKVDHLGLLLCLMRIMVIWMPL